MYKIMFKKILGMRVSPRYVSVLDYNYIHSYNSNIYIYTYIYFIHNK